MTARPRKFRIGLAAAIFPIVALHGCGTADVTDVRSDTPRLYEFDVPQPVDKVYVREVEMFRTCKVGPISKIFGLSIDPSFDPQTQTASLTVVATGYFDPQNWNLIDMRGHGATTHVRVYGESHPALPHLGQDIEKWANGWTNC